MRAALVIWTLSAVVCMGRGHHHTGHDEVGDQTDQETTPENSASQVALENKNFAFRLYRQLAAHPDNQGKNIFFSPASVSVALAALSVGTRGETHKQLFRGLGFSSPLLTQENVDQAFQMLLDEAIKTLGEDVSQGTAVFTDHRYKVKPEFLQTLQQSYFADGFLVDFTKTKESTDTINTYVANKTNGKIDELVASLDPRTVMYLISYIYYKGKWETPFNPQDTKEADFTVDANTTVLVQMMNINDSFSAYYDPGVQTSVLHLPFNNSYSMLLMLPDDMATLEQTICPNHITKWLRWMERVSYNIYVPKFSIKTSYSLKEVLTDMGMPDMFGDRADLSGIAEGLAVSEVVHQATLDVDEVGATAAAATGIQIMLMSLRHVSILKFNRPFMVAIIERSTEKLLFMGKIVNPNI